MSIAGEDKAGLDALNKLKSTDPPVFLSPNSDLSLSSRLASQYLFASLKPYTPKSPFDQLLTDGFDAEQIWQQIDIQSQPLISSLKREIRRFEKNPDQISSLFGKPEASGGLEREIKENGHVGLEADSDEFEGLSDDDEGEEEDDDEAAEEREMEEGEEEEEDDEDESEADISEGEGVPEVEDEFLKIKDLEKYLAREEEREYGSEEKQKKKKKGKIATKAPREDDDEDMDDEEDDDEGEADEMGNDLLLYGGDDDDDDEEGGANIRYEDFFVPGKQTPKRKRKQDESGGSEAEDEDDELKKGKLSTYEKERQKIEAKIKEMEEANLGEKDWTMQGEVTAAKRPKDSALEVDLDFEQNVRPPPVITEEVTASLEDIIKKRILEGNFDDVQRAPKLPSKAPKEFKELDDKKSKKGLAEVYEEEYYAQQTGLATPVSVNDELRTEASKLFKALCLKLDALSHFHFAPKPVVEDMSIQANVPALAMEEIAPMAVSDAAMLAPEEVFAGKGDIKEETELTKEDRKRRRAKKKRNFKVAKARRTAERASEKKKLKTNDEGKEQ